MDLSHQQQACLDIAKQFTFMPLSNSNLDHETIKDSITFFGGSFFPFHQGHLSCLQLCPEKNIVIILDRNPQKESRDFLPYDEYLKISEYLKGTSYLVYPGFWASSEKNPTCDWLPLVKIPEKNLLMGDDTFMDLLGWKSAEKVLSAITKIYVVPRNYSESVYLIQKNKIILINPKIEIIFLDDHPFKHISSTTLRL